MAMILPIVSSQPRNLFASRSLPGLTGVLQEGDSNVAPLDVFHAREDLLDVRPVDDKLAIHLIAEDFDDVCPS